MLTPLALALVMVETTDVVFAVDSIPAIFAITADPFLVFTSNVFAILGLRSLYFALAGAIEAFRYLKVALAVVLAVVGVKMLTHSWLKGVLGPNFNLYLLGVVWPSWPSECWPPGCTVRGAPREPPVPGFRAPERTVTRNRE